MSSSAPKCASVVAYHARTFGIGLKGNLPWRLENDMKWFKTLTATAAEGKQNAVVMGRKTWESIPKRFRPLSGRINVVLTRQPSYDTGDTTVATFVGIKEAIESLSKNPEVDRIFIIGGGTVYKEAWEAGLCNAIYATEVHGEAEVDTYVPMPESLGFKRQGDKPIQSGEEGQFKYEMWLLTKEA
eukprot:Clim_evm11s136 gene=Clim_evmTU11s136